MAALLAAALTFAGCQDGYPIAATRCDRVCDFSQGKCDGDSPSACVVTCEEGLRMSGCYEEFDKLLECIEEHGKILACFTASPGSECEAEQRVLEACAVRRRPPTASGSE
jgi:hypothetical protein